MSEPPFDPYAYAATESANTSDDDSLVARAPEGAPAPAPCDPKLSVSLPASSWDAIVALLGGYPYSQVAVLIDAIKLQTGCQLSQLRLLEALWSAPPSDSELSVSLPASSWDVITTLLVGYPYSQVAAFVDAIKLQTSSQLLEIHSIQRLMALPVDTTKQ